MANKTAWRLLRSLTAEERGKAVGAHARRLGSSVILNKKNGSSVPTYAFPRYTPSCNLFTFAAPLVTRQMKYSECRNVGYTPEQMYNVVANVDKYHQFVPWCSKSEMVRRRNGDWRAYLEIGFPPVVEQYTSEVMLLPNHQIRAVCVDGSLFNHLETVWRFTPGHQDFCILDFTVSFEFRSLLHSHLATVFFDEVVKKMVDAFEKRLVKLYGSQTGMQR